LSTGGHFEALRVESSRQRADVDYWLQRGHRFKGKRRLCSELFKMTKIGTVVFLLFEPEARIEIFFNQIAGK
jgi:hypothetical protein